ncbi:MAG: hypothetical protein ACRDYA_18180 [Egibacteraceae bacterium]
MRRRSKVRVALVASVVMAMSMLGAGVASANELDSGFEETRHDCRWPHHGPPWRDHCRRGDHDDRKDRKDDRKDHKDDRKDDRKDHKDDRKDDRKDHKDDRKGDRKDRKGD